MNSEPHIHNVKIRAFAGGHCSVVQYGDTNVHVHAGPWKERRLRRGIRRAIRKHDKGSVDNVGVLYQRLSQETNQTLREHSGQWASAVLGGEGVRTDEG